MEQGSVVLPDIFQQEQARNRGTSGGIWWVICSVDFHLFSLLLDDPYCPTFYFLSTPLYFKRVKVFRLAN
jgi:hypothetical protein